MALRSGTGKAGHRPSLPSRPLLSLIPGEDLSANIKLEGNLISIVPYDVSTRTCAFTIVQNSCRVKCLLKGPWSMAAPEYLRTKMNRAICIITDGTETVKIVSQERDRNGDPVMGGNQLGVSFENGISGYWRGEGGNGRKEPFHLKSRCPRFLSVQSGPRLTLNARRVDCATLHDRRVVFRARPRLSPTLPPSTSRSRRFRLARANQPPGSSRLDRDCQV